jgi:hypothetical protein
VGLQIGSEQFITTEFYQPLDHAQHTFIRPFAFFDSRLIGLYNDGDRFADYTFHDARVGAEAGLKHRHLRPGAPGPGASLAQFPARHRARPVPGLQGPRAGPTFNVVLDTEDQAYFPTKGFQGRLDYFDAMKATGDSAVKYAKLSGGLEGVYSIRDVSLIGGDRRRRHDERHASGRRPLLARRAAAPVVLRERPAPGRAIRVRAHRGQWRSPSPSRCWD